MSDFMVTTTIARPKVAIPSAQQPGAAAPPRFTAPTVTEPRKSGGKPTPAQVKAKRLEQLRARRTEIGNTDLLEKPPQLIALPTTEKKPMKAAQQIASKPCTHCAEPRLRVGPYCSEHKRQKNAEYLARKAKGASKKRTALKTRQKTIAAKRAEAPPEAVKPRGEAAVPAEKPKTDYVKLGQAQLGDRDIKPENLPTAGLRYEATIREVRSLLPLMAYSKERDDAILTLFDGLIALLLAG